MSKTRIKKNRYKIFYNIKLIDILVSDNIFFVAQFTYKYSKTKPKTNFYLAFCCNFKIISTLK